MNQNSKIMAAAISFLVTAILLSSSHAQNLDSQQKAKLRRLTQLVDKAGQAFKSKEFKDSAKSIRSAQRLMISMAKSGDAELINALKKDFDRLGKARTLLEQQGEKFDELPNLSALAADASQGSDSKSNEGGEMVSFTKQVAPIIVEHCGKCHVQRSLGKYSAATYNELKKGTRKGMAVKPNDIEKSRLITLVENGTMPPKGKGTVVPPEKLAVLKTWIEQGAKFDGANKEKKANLNEFIATEGSDSKPPGNRLGQPSRGG